MSVAKEFYKIATQSREQLGDFLLLEGKYETLKTALGELQTKYSDDKNFIENLLLGKIGYEHNKQNAIYELPTTELVSTIQKVCKLLGMEKVEELMAGSGLLSSQLSLGTDLSVHATDGQFATETMGIKFTTVDTKGFLEYALDEENVFDDTTAMLVAWPLVSLYPTLFHVIDKVKPKVIMVLSEFYASLENPTRLVTALESISYSVRVLPVKTISFRGSYLPEESGRSSTLMLAVHSSCVKQTTTEELAKLLQEECFEEVVYDLSPSDILRDLYKIEYAPEFCSTAEPDVQRKVVVLLEKIYSDITITKTVPLYLNSVEEIEFWYKTSKEKMYPTKIKNREKFEEYYSVYQKITSIDTVRQMVAKKIFPSWVTTRLAAKKLLFLDYSTEANDKQWKESYSKFNNKYNTVTRGSRIEFDSFPLSLNTGSSGTGDMSSIISSLFGV